MSTDPNMLATHWLMANEGPKEQYGPNDGPWLRLEENAAGDPWMWQGHNPYCAEVGVKRAYQRVGIDLEYLFPHVNWAYCPDIVQAFRHGMSAHGVKLQQVSWLRARFGDIVLFDWQGDGLADHVGHITSLPRLKSTVATIEANTPPSAGGDQSGHGGGDGIYRKTRQRSSVILVGRVVKA